MDAPEAADYRTTLNELVANNKNTINLLTILAEDYSSIAPAIVDSIDKHLHRVNRDQKLPTMYLTDSIIKNLQVPYKQLFERIIVKMFVHTFHNGDERVRSSLFKLRDTWKDIFSRGKLYELDIKVNQEDPNWPIETPTASGSKGAVKAATGTAAHPPTAQPDKKVHVNPKFMDKMAAAALPLIKKDASRAVPSTSRAVKVEDSEVKVEVKPILKKPVAISGRDPRATKDPRPAKEKVEEPVKKIKAEPVDEPMPSDPVPSFAPKKQIKVETVEAPPVRNEPKVQEKKDERRKRSGEERREKRREESDRSPPPKHSRRSPPRHMNPRQMQRPMNPMAGIPVKPNVIPPSRPHIPPPAPAVATPTNVVGSHAFSIAPRAQPSPPIQGGGGGKPPMHGNMSFPPPVSMPSSNPLNSSAFVTGPIPGLLTPFAAGPNNPFGPNRSMPPPPGPLPMGGGPPMGGAPFMPPPPLQRPPPVHERKHVFKDDNRLEGIPANNRIFVDGKAYEVLYINETAVIEKDGLPHRIYFQGVPRNVVIDGVAYLMSFGENREVMIDNDVHLIRFGAPSRELYMGDYPFKGAFGGPPIIATINGRRHEIRLAGPAPEVKIEPEPSYELSRFLSQARADSQLQMNPRPAQPPVAAPPPVKVEPKADLNSLLSKLKKSGIMNMLGKGEASPPPAPIESDIRGGSDRAAAPVALFEKEPFDMRLLKTRYTSVVTALLAKRAVCEHCGLRFDSLSGVRYEKHLDWHVRRNLAAATTKETKSRAWYCSAQDWINAKDTAEDEDSGEGVDPFGKLSALAQTARNEEEAKKPSLNTNDAVSKTCAVCGEDFEEYYDEDSDTWKLKDCMQIGGQTCHESCASDLSRIEEESTIDKNTLKSEEEDDKPVSSSMDASTVSPTKILQPVDPRLAAKSSPMA
ncbi:hypothetical protein PFISCL1PPCAC_10744 [Pristionchus fissidentatus]|uniref:CID domain-containing protein n=1 Tax=Pristionchus fissidentatus TaxID=1538716 RepID=A0AAV5VI86_9BILA|nr:hypothetical protein PFISCL1PPCAC_10744 [Pristionchus fissidentatus]